MCQTRMNGKAFDMNWTLIFWSCMSADCLLVPTQPQNLSGEHKDSCHNAYAHFPCLANEHLLSLNASEICFTVYAKALASIELTLAFMFINLDPINISQVILSNSALQGALRVSLPRFTVILFSKNPTNPLHES